MTEILDVPLLEAGRKEVASIPRGVVEQPNTPKVGDTWYRYDDKRYGSFDEYGARTFVYVRVEEQTYEVAKVTPKGVWLDLGWNGRRFVRHDARKKFAAPTRAEAMASLVARKERQARILRAQLKHVENAVRIGQEQLAAATQALAAVTCAEVSHV